MGCSESQMRRWPAFLLTLLLTVLLALPAGASAQSSADKSLQKALSGAMGAAGPASGAFVLNATDRGTLYKLRSDTARILASNTKIFTTAAALDELGADARFKTVVLGDGIRDDVDGTWDGDLYLRGGGDPSFGSESFVQRSYGGKGATVEELADQIEALGITSVTGRVYGDESLFDSLRGGPADGYRTSVWVGPISALSFNRGLAAESGSSFQANPPAFAAARLDAALEKLDITVRGKPAAGTAPDTTTELASVESPPLGELARMTMKPSDNFFAEMLLKKIADAQPGSTKSGTRAAMAHAAKFDAKAQLVDGSGLARGNKSSPRAIVRLLDGMIGQPTFDVFQNAFPIAGKDGTLKDRMRSGLARGRCRAKTGTISGVSTLSGYCRARSGDTIVFSILMNNVYPSGARKLQDRMVQAMAKYNG